MSFNGMTGMGQFGNDQFTWTSQYNMTRKGSVTVQQQPKSKKPVLFNEDEDCEPSLYFSAASVFNPKDMSINTSSAFQPLDHERSSSSSVFNIRETMSSPSSQLGVPFGTNLYAPQSGGVSIQQRGMSNAGFPQRNSNPGHVTPTSSISSNFPINTQQQTSPNRNLFPSIGQQGLISRLPTSQIPTLQKRTNPITSGMLSSNTNSITSMPAFGRPQFDCFGTSDSSQQGFDLSEFPTLGNRTISSNPAVQTPRSYGVVVNKQVTEPTPEFQIQQEDFPALPGAQNPPTSQSNDTTSKTPTSTSGSGSYEQAVSKDGKFPGDKASGQSQSKRGIQTHPDGMVSNIPLGMVNDQFGMVGLLTFIRGAETDPNLVALAPGIDLTTLGLNLNSPENLYSTFQSPWADAPCRPQDIDFHVPSEYLTNLFIKEKLAPIKLNRYGEDLLFFLFYMNGGDVLQLAAAAELYSRDWRYHKEERVWITRAPGMEPMVKTNSYERGTYYFFDAQNWRKVPKEFHLEYDKLEDHPHMPQLHQNQTQPIMAH